MFKSLKTITKAAVDGLKNFLEGQYYAQMKPIILKQYGT